MENFASVREAVDHGVSIVTQEFSLLPDLSIAENIFLADKKYYKGGFLADKKAMAAQTYSLLALFGMEKTIDPYAKVSRLSVAQMQVIEILKAVSTQARVIILDEPTRGIDVGAKYEIYQLIIDLANRGKTVLMVSSEMPELLGVCDRILVMSGGRLAGEVDAKTTSQEEIMRLAAKYV